MSAEDAAGREGGPVASSSEVFLERLRACVDARRADGASLAVLLIDCGLVGRIDALWGYQVGDAVRGRILASLRADVLRAEDFAGEFGRDEFACVLALVDGAQLALLAAEKALRILNTPMFLGDDEIYASPAVGVAVFPDTADSAEALLQQAKSACTAATCAISRVALFADGQSNLAAQLIGESRMRTAITEDGLDLAFQPQFDLRFGQILGMEAMLRWRDGGREMVPMREVVEAAAAGGQVAKLVSSLMNRALRNCSEFRQRAGLDLRVAVNLPVRLLLEPEVPDLVERALRTWSLRPGRLMLEINDVAELQYLEPARAAIARLHAIGVKLSIDDARAPLSSLFWLATMPFQELKIDLSMASDWTSEPRSEGVLRTLIDLVHQLKLDVMAISVPDEASASRLVALGCDFMQADFKGPPVDPEVFVDRFAG